MSTTMYYRISAATPDGFDCMASAPQGSGVWVVGPAGRIYDQARRRYNVRYDLDSGSIIAKSKAEMDTELSRDQWLHRRAQIADGKDNFKYSHLGDMTKPQLYSWLDSRIDEISDLDSAKDFLRLVLKRYGVAILALRDRTDLFT